MPRIQLGIAGLALSAALLAGCAGQNEPKIGTPPPAELAAGAPVEKMPAGSGANPRIPQHPEMARPLHRFHPGDTWTYSSGSGPTAVQATLTVLPDQVRAPDGTACLVIESASPGPGGRMQTADGAFEQDTNGSEILRATPGVPPRRFSWGTAQGKASVRLRSPIYPGLNWQDMLELDNGHRQFFSAYVEKPETVTVPAGTFKTFLVHQNTATIDRKQHRLLMSHQDDVWVDPAVAFPVKQITHIGKTSSLRELVHYHLAKG